MYSIGADLHKDTVVISVLDSNGQLVERKTLATKCKNTIRAYFSSYGLQCQVAFESVGFYQWFWELLKPVVGKLHLADPVGIRAHAGRKAKTDRNDSLLIAQLLHEKKLPTAYVPEEPVASLRKLVRLRHGIAGQLAGTRKSLRWISLKTNLPGPKVLASDNAQKWVLAQEDKFSECDKKAARLDIDIIISLERALRDIEREIKDYIKKFPQLEKLNSLFQSIAGVGDIVAATIIAETGDIARFDNPGQISCYAGLCPKVSQSGESIHHGHISKMGPPLLRWVLQQAAWVAIRTSDEVRRIFNRIARKAGAKKAATAIARKLLVYAWSVARRGQPFKWPAKDVKKEPDKKNEGTMELCYQI